MRMIKVLLVGSLVGSAWGTLINPSMEYLKIAILAFVALRLFPEEKTR